MSQNIEDIKNEIAAHGPVQALIKVYSDFFLYGTGVYRYTRYNIFNDLQKNESPFSGQQDMDFSLVTTL